MSSASRVPLLLGNKGRKPTRLPIAPRARPSNVDRVKRGAATDEVATEPTEEQDQTSKPTSATTPAKPHDSPERKALPPVLAVTALAPLEAAVASSPSAPRAGGISPGHSISSARNGASLTRASSSLPQTLTAGNVRSPMLSASHPVERLAKMNSKSSIPLFRPQEPRTHASPILGPRATPIPAPHGPQNADKDHHQNQEQNPLLKRLTRKLDIKPHQSPRRAALNQAPVAAPRTASPLMLSTPAPTAADVPSAPLNATTSAARPAKRGTKRRNPQSDQENKKKVANKPAAPRRALGRKAKKGSSYSDPTDARAEKIAADSDDDDYEQEHDEDDDDNDNHDDSVDDAGLDLPEAENPPVYMPARERATLWAKKVLRQQEDADNGTVTDIVQKKEKRKRSNSTSSVASISTNATVASRKSKNDELLKKEPSQMTMGELALSIPKGRRMLRHEQEENSDHHFGAGHGHALNRVRSMSMSSETPSFGGGSIVTPQVQIIDGKMVISEATVNVHESVMHAQPEHDFTDDSVRRPRGTRYLAAASTPGRRWSKDETKQFYYCLSQVGPNFSMMATLFPTRKRKELKCKFKYEEKHHPGLIEIALKASAAPLDSEIVDVISQMADKETKKKEAKRRKHSEASLDDGGLSSPATVSSSAVPTPPPDDDEMEFSDSEYYHQRKNSFDFAG